MKTYSVLVLGANGMLGSAISSHFNKIGFNTFLLTRKDFDVLSDDLKLLNKWIKKSDFVINALGIIKPRIKDFTVNEVIKVNSIFPQNLQLLCKKNKSKLIHISTDCVFSGKKGYYNELDLIDPSDLYGQSKALGEPSDCMVIRTSIIGEEKNSKRSLIEWLKSNKGKSVNGFSNHKWNGFTTKYFAQILEKIIKKNKYKIGLFHLHSKRCVNKYMLLKKLNETFKLNIKIKNTKDKLAIDRSLSSIHSLSKQLAVKSIPDQITELID